MSESSTDCWKCRLTSGSGLFFGGLYVTHQSKKLKFHSHYVRFIGYAISTLGVLRLLNLPPFRNRSHSEEKKRLDVEENEYIIGKFPSKF